MQILSASPFFLQSCLYCFFPLFFVKPLFPSFKASPFASYCAGCQIILPRENEPVLLGAAVLGAVAGKKFPVVHDAMKALKAAGKVFPNIPSAVLYTGH
jgi:hypothetical protein